jgi:hypothetical protein
MTVNTSQAFRDPQPWIPPGAMVAGQAAHGLSWLLLATAPTGTAALAWVHVVALGWLTTIALAVLIHVIPGVLDVEWRGGRLARAAIAPVWLGAIAMALGFWRADFPLVAGAAGVIALALATYMGCAAATLRQAAPGPVKRAFTITFTALALAAGMGLAAALMLRGNLAWWAPLPALHAHVAAIGWLTLLVVGVSARTVKRITGAKPDGPWLHIAAASLLLAALFPLAAGFPLVAAGLGTAGALAHALELGVMVKRAREPHRPPQAFIATAGIYLVLAAGLGVGVALGHAEWQPAYVFLALAGWLGQMVNGHVHHIGVRLLATMVRGDEDETEPIDLLSPMLSWGAFIASQVAVVGGAVALLAGVPLLLQVSALVGFLGWALMGANGRHAYVTASAG